MLSISRAAFQGRHALAVGRAFVNLVAAVAGLDRGHVLAAVGGEVVESMQAAQAAEVAHDVLGDRAAVEGVAAILGDALQGLGQQRLAVQGADPRHLAARREGGACGRIVGDQAGQAGPMLVHLGGDRVAVAGETDRRLQDLAQLLGAVVAQ
jgi:hypothetical protein